MELLARMRLEIVRVEAGDFTSYRCVAKNSLGETDGKIRLFGESPLHLSPTPVLPPPPHHLSPPEVESPEPPGGRTSPPPPARSDPSTPHYSHS